MTEIDEERADALFHALADRTRRDIMRRVLAGEHSVSALAAKYDMSFAAVQKHVAVLEKAGLLTKRRNGREQLASGDVTAVRSVASMLTELVCGGAGWSAHCGAGGPRQGVPVPGGVTNRDPDRLSPASPRSTRPCTG